MYIENLTLFSITPFVSFSRDDRELVVVLVTASFELPRRVGDAPSLCPEQPGPTLTDVYIGEPSHSSLAAEGQSAYTRPGTDVYIHGSAWTPRGRPAPWVGVDVRVGPLQRCAMIFGDRRYVVHAGQVVPSTPSTFEQLPLIWEHAFGGDPGHASMADRALAEQNPVGRGLHPSPSDALGELLPNIEDPNALISHPGDRPTPIGFGPVARHWLPRRELAGTYDQAWLEKRAPLWPKDMDERLFCAAAPGLCATPHLCGGEPVSLGGLHPDGLIAFALPQLRLQAKFRGSGSTQRRPLVLDAVTIDCSAWRLQLVWRTHAVTKRGSIGFRELTLRNLEAWEQAA